MTDRQRFWLKVFLAVTFPLWILPAILAALVAGICLVIWMGVSDIVDPLPSCNDHEDDGP